MVIVSKLTLKVDLSVFQRANEVAGESASL